MQNVTMLYKHRYFSLETPMEIMASIKRTFFNCDISTQYHAWSTAPDFFLNQMLMKPLLTQ